MSSRLPRDRFLKYTDDYRAVPLYFWSVSINQLYYSVLWSRLKNWRGTTENFSTILFHNLVYKTSTYKKNKPQQNKPTSNTSPPKQTPEWTTARSLPAFPPESVTYRLRSSTHSAGSEGDSEQSSYLQSAEQWIRRTRIWCHLENGAVAVSSGVWGCSFGGLGPFWNP